MRGLNVAIGGVHLLDDVSFEVGRGEIVGLVGESGSGKTLTGLSVLQLLPPRTELTGSITVNGAELIGLSAPELRRVRGAQVAMIFQEPRASLHPSRPIGKQLTDVVLAHEGGKRRDAASRAMDLLDRVGLPSPRRTMKSYTFELSGGMCQRVMIAMSMIVRPRLLIADEPTTALDVTIQAQIMSLLQDVAEEHDVSVLLISHNLGLISETCSRVITMYCGEVVNDDTVDGLRCRPRHPYPAALLDASRLSFVRDRADTGISGAPADPARPPAGCRFSPRCPHVVDRCLSGPVAMETFEDDRRTRCLRHDELELGGAQ